MRFLFFFLSVIRFHASQLRRSDQEARFRPSDKWSDTMGTDAFPSTLLLFIKVGKPFYYAK